MHIKKIAIVGLVAVGLSGCQTTGVPNDQALATGAGAVVGIAVGSFFGGGAGKIAAMAIGGAVGAVIGNEIGKNLSTEDQKKENTAMVQALTTAQPGVAVNWTDMSSDASGTVTVTAESNRDGQPCKAYSETLTVSGKTESLQATSCRGTDGQWHRTTT